MSLGMLPHLACYEVQQYEQCIDVRMGTYSKIYRRSKYQSWKK